MRRLIFITVLLFATLSCISQDRRVQNKPYIDLRNFHFGVIVGTHVQDLELRNTAPKVVNLGDGAGDKERVISVDQARWDARFTVGVLGELRLNQTFQFRIAPTLYFGTRHITFNNYSDLFNNEKPTSVSQTIKTAYVACALDFIAAAPRFNNHRPYIMLGVVPMLNITNKSNDYLRLKGREAFIEIGVGCDFYLPYFKLRPELKFMFGLSNCLNSNYVKRLKDKRTRMYSNSVDYAQSKLIALTFYFE